LAQTETMKFIKQLVFNIMDTIWCLKHIWCYSDYTRKTTIGGLQ